MRIAIDARKLHDFGIGTYIRNLLRQLARLDAETEYVLLCRSADLGIAAQLGPNFRTQAERSRPYSLAEQLSIPVSLRRARADLFHAPHYVLPPLSRGRAIVTIHDCIHLMFPQYLPSRAAYLYARTFLWSACRQADRILTVSEASKRDIVHLLGVSEAKITVIPNAIDEGFWVPPPEEEVQRIRARFQLDRPFLLYVGNVKPHKNLERLIEAFHLVRQRKIDLTLLIIGDEITRYTALRQAVHRYQLHKYVRFLGYVPDQTLAILYRLATAFVFPSLYEGFGLPPLEAMASGTPVVTSNVSSLPEVVGDAAQLVDPYDPASIAEAIERVVCDPTLRAQMVERGHLRAREFSWERSVRRIREIYTEVVDA